VSIGPDQSGRRKAISGNMSILKETKGNAAVEWVENVTNRSRQKAVWVREQACNETHREETTMVSQRAYQPSRYKELRFRRIFVS